MGVYEITNELEAAINSNLATHMAAIDVAKDVKLVKRFKLYKRERAETFYQRTLPGVGVWIFDVSTGAVSQARRKWDATAGIDYFFQGTDRQDVAKQVELTLDAMMRVIDGLTPAAGTNTIQGASENQFATQIVHDIDDLVQEASVGVGEIISGFRIMLPVTTEDQV